MTRGIENLRQLERKSQRIGSIIDQRRATLDQIGTGQVRLDKSSDPQTYLDTALKIGSAKKRVTAGIERLETRRTELAGQVQDRKLQELRSYVDQGILPPSVLEPFGQVAEVRPKVLEQTIVEAPVTPPQPEEPIDVRLPDGQVFSTTSPGIAKLLQRLISTESLSTPELSIEIFGEDSRENWLKVRHLMGWARRRLLNSGWEIKNSAELKRGLPGLFSLENIEKPKETEAIEFTLPDGQITQTLSANIAKLIEALSTGPASTGELSEHVFGENNPENKIKTRHVIEKAIANLRSRGWTITNRNLAGPIGQPGLYGLVKMGAPSEEVSLPAERIRGMRITQVQPEVFGQPTKRAAEEVEPTSARRGYQKDSIIPDFYEKKPRVVNLPNGETVGVDSAWPYYLAQYIAEGANSAGEIAERVFGEDTVKNRGRVSAAVAGANKTIRGSGFIFKNIVSASERYKGVIARYEFQARGEMGPTPRPKPTAATPAASQTALGLAEVIEVPYVPSPEEIRTLEETRIISALNSQLTKSLRINFEQLQSAIFTEERVRTSHGKRMYMVYHAEEIGRIFESGVKKLKEESVVTGLRQRWMQEDEALWQETQRVINILKLENDFEEYIRMVKRLTDSSERILKNESGAVPDWINL